MIVCHLLLIVLQEKYELLKADADVQVGLEANGHVFYKVCGGWSDKGTIYGLGREGPSMFSRPSRYRGSSVVLVFLSIGYPASGSISNQPN